MIEVAVYKVPLPLPGSTRACVAVRLVRDGLVDVRGLVVVEIDTEKREILCKSGRDWTDEETSALEAKLDMLVSAARGEFNE